MGQIIARMASPYRSEVSVLCFGDSLTAGHHPVRTSWKPAYHPYSRSLERCVNAEPSLAGKVDIVTDGLDGSAVRQFLERLKQATRLRNFDVVVIYGGINDLGRMYDARETFEKLTEVYKYCMDRDMKVVACTLTELRLDGQIHKDKSQPHPRHSYNSMIKEFANGHKESVSLVDLDKDFPLFSLSDDERTRLYAPDEIHYMPDGYDRVGELIAAKVIPLCKAKVEVSLADTTQ